MSRPKLVPFKPQPGPQTYAIQNAWIYEMLYGGARGGGKSHWLLGDFAQEIPGPGGDTWNGIIFRRTLPQLDDLVRKSQIMYPMWFGKDKVEWKVSDKTWHWENGATLKMRYLENPNDWMEYQGHEYCWVGFDELTAWSSPDLYLKMMATIRSGNPAHKFRRIRATANPGGPGHSWVKERFKIGMFPMGSKIIKDPQSNKFRVFVKAKVTDNLKLLEAQPDYVDTLKGVGSEAQVKMWLDGDWDQVLGAYFTEFSTTKHVIPPFEIPPSWTRIRMMDWGGASPGAVLWGAISDGMPTWDGRKYPKGAMVIYREWYTARQSDGGSWVGLKLSNEELVRGILELEGETEIPDDSIVDPAAYAAHGGPSIAEQIARLSQGRIMFRRGDNQRIPGWATIRERLIGGLEGPMIYFFDTCPHIIRTLPALPHDETKPEDVDTDSEDHAPDALRYGCMSRPWVRESMKPSPRREEGLYSLDELYDWNSRRHTKLRLG